MISVIISEWSEFSMDGYEVEAVSESIQYVVVLGGGGLLTLDRAARLTAASSTACTGSGRRGRRLSGGCGRTWRREAGPVLLLIPAEETQRIQVKARLLPSLTSLNLETKGS